MYILVSPSKTQNPAAPDAVHFFTGEVFRQLDLQSYTQIELDYLYKSLIILSDKYGYILASDKVKPHRPLLKSNKAKRLFPKVTKFLKSLDGPILNLSSLEYSRLISPKLKVTHITFPKQPSVYIKKARGKILHYCIKNNITTTDSIDFATLI